MNRKIGNVKQVFMFLQIGEQLVDSSFTITERLMSYLRPNVK